METWAMANFEQTGAFRKDLPIEVKRKYGEVRSANIAFHNDIHNLSIGYHQMKRVMEDQEMESGLKGLYLSNLVENYITNIRCIYDHMAVFSRIVLDHSIITNRNVSTDSLNDLLKYIIADTERAGKIFTEAVAIELTKLAPGLEVIKAIRDAIIHDGKEPMVTFSSGQPNMIISRSPYHREENLLPNLLNHQTSNYPMFPYLQHLTKRLFADMENLGAELIKYFISKDDSYRVGLVALIGICIEDFVNFINTEY